ncbi:MAG: hypothetical protein HY430_03940 [Candidatus Levybacteria bacterium]|nr:hypothetical protein [Candidatus Levybacteria bacterium]
MPSAPRDNIFPFIRHEQVAKDAYAFFFNTSEKDFSFIPGQYIRIQLTLPEPDPKGNGRFFSLTTSPLQKDMIRIVTRVRGSVFKNTLLNLAPETPVTVFGPVGRFVLDEQSTKPLVFLAGGIGITPYLSMIQYAAEKNLSLPMTLIASFSTVEDCIYYNTLSQVAREHKNIKIVFSISQPEASRPKDDQPLGLSSRDRRPLAGTTPWKGEVGRISAELIKKYVPEYYGSMFYIAGPPPMVEGMLGIVSEMGVPPESIKKEQFTGY